MPHSPARSARQAGGLVIAAGSMFTTVGIGAWMVITKQLRDEKICVPDNAPLMAGCTVQGPVSAFAQAQAIEQNAERGAGGRTFSEISEALKSVEKGSDEEHELRKQSASLSTAASLRTSLMTSVMAYGISALVTGLGAIFVITGRRIR